MKEIPENILKFLSGSSEGDIELGLFLLLDYFENQEDYHKYLWNLYAKNPTKYSDMQEMFHWKTYFYQNKTLKNETTN